MSPNESIVENAAIEWSGELGYAVGHGPHLAPGEPAAERDSFGEVALDSARCRGCVTVAVQPHARYVPPHRVLAVLSASPEGMALRDLRKRLGEGLLEWELKKWTAPFGCIPILQRPLNNPASSSRYQGLDGLEPLATFEDNPRIADMLCPWRTRPRVPHPRTT